MLVLESGYLDPPAPADRPIVEGLRGGAAVLMVAAFEQYLKAGIAEGVDSINAANPPCQFAKFPAAFKVNAVFSALEFATSGRRTGRDSTKQQRLPDVLTTVRRLHVREVDGEALGQTNGNPNSERVVALFKAIGYERLWTRIKPSFDKAWGAPTAVTFVPDTLNAIVARRHVVAHTASALAIARSDLAAGQRFLEVLVSVLDPLLDRHVQRLIAQAQ